MESACIKDQEIVVYFHHGCIDAAFANLAVAELHKNQQIFYYSKAANAEVKLFPIARLYYFVEVVEENLLRFACEHGERVVVIDHHVSNMHILEMLQKLYTNLQVAFDVSRSACQIAWIYLNIIPADNVQWAMDYVEDSDLWRFQLENSRQINAGMREIIREVHPVRNPLIFQQMREINPESVIKRGQIALAAYQEGLRREMLYPRLWLRLKEFKVLAIFIKNSRFRNDIGHCLATESKEQGGISCGAVAYLDKKQGKIKVSLRSLKEFDISNIVAEYGGGGHSHAGSFTVDENTFNYLKIKHRPGRRR